MRLFLLFIGLVSVCGALVGCKSVEQALQEDPGNTVIEPIAAYRARITVEDDALGQNHVFSTQNGFRRTNFIMFSPESDAFLRGFVAKADGTKSFQVYVVMAQTSGWMYPQGGEFGNPPTTVRAQRLHDDKYCSRNICTFREHAAFTVPEGELRRAVAPNSPERANGQWLFRVRNNSGTHYNDFLPLNEIEALLQTVDAASATRQ